MAKKSTALSVLKTILLAFLVFLVIAAGVGLYLIHGVILPRYNRAASQNGEVRQELTGSDVIGFAKYLTDKQVLDNLKNFDKDAAKGVLEAMTELEEEIAAEEPQEVIPAETAAPVKENPSAADNTAWDKTLTEPMDKLKPSAPAEAAPEPTPEPPAIPKEDVPAGGQSAYDRIMAAASEDEISVGFSIISKVDLATVKKYQSEGKNEELKKYIKDRLTSSEISTSLSLYNKYKHLL